MKYYELKEIIEDKKNDLFTLINIKRSKSQLKFNKTYSTLLNKKFGLIYIYGMDISNLFSVENYFII